MGPIPDILAITRCVLQFVTLSSLYVFKLPGMSASPAPAGDQPAVSQFRSDAEARASLGGRYRAVRERSVALALPISPEDAMVQSMPDTSPTKWHLAHTTWFFERFVLGARDDYVPLDPQWDFLFNSYYNSVGPMHARPQRGLISRPTLTEVLDYRRRVDERIAQRVDAGDIDQDVQRVLLLGTHHEQQHQELLLTDIKHALWSNPLGPAYRDDLPIADCHAAPLRWIARDEAIVEIGAHAWPDADDFAFDSESPRHRVLIGAHALASRTVSNAEYAQFVDDGGYDDPLLWMSDGWALLQDAGIRRPLYWHDDGAREFTLGGWRERDSHAPACHLSYFEADAFARWAGARLPTEAEWEQAAAGIAIDGNFVESGLLHPGFAGTAAHHAGRALEEQQDQRFEPSPAKPRSDENGAARHRFGEPPQQLFGDVWEWTSSAYGCYPGFAPLPGALGEYNGKFMSGQWILRGGSCATPRDHMRHTYRNFFPPPARWQFSGLRLARDSA